MNGYVDPGLPIGICATKGETPYPKVELEKAVQTLRSGGVVAHPTETVFGLGADPFNPQALNLILELKGRDATKGFILLVQSRADLQAVVGSPPPQAEYLMDRFWPGPLTLILPAHPTLPNLVTGGRATVAVRHSSSPHVAALLKGWGKPMVSTSANVSGQPPLRDSTAVRKIFAPQVVFTLSGCCPPEVPPTTIVTFDDHFPKILRQGSVTDDMLRTVLPHIFIELF